MVGGVVGCPCGNPAAGSSRLGPRTLAFTAETGGVEAAGQEMSMRTFPIVFASTAACAFAVRSREK